MAHNRMDDESKSEHGNGAPADSPLAETGFPLKFRRTAGEMDQLRKSQGRTPAFRIERFDRIEQWVDRNCASGCTHSILLGRCGANFNPATGNPMFQTKIAAEALARGHDDCQGMIK
jgi:hypothetical protein